MEIVVEMILKKELIHLKIKEDITINYRFYKRKHL